MAEKTILSAASFYSKKVYFDETIQGLPEGVKIELKDICQKGAELTEGVFSVGFTVNGEVFFESSGDETDYHYDDIGAQLIVNKMITENAPLIKAVQLWHALYMTEEGKKLKEKIISYENRKKEI